MHDEDSERTAQLAELTNLVAAILAQPDLALASAPALTSLDEKFFRMAYAGSAARAVTLRARYVAAMDRAARDPRFVLADQLGFIDAKMGAFKGFVAPNKLLPTSLLRLADQRFEAALTVEQSPYVRPGLVNAALSILEDTDQYAKAYQIAKAEIARSDAPYYFQADLAGIAENSDARTRPSTCSTSPTVARKVRLRAFSGAALCQRAHTHGTE